MTRELEDWISSYMQYTENTEPPKQYHLWTAISTIAAALQRKCMLEWGTIKFFPNMYIVLVGPPGKARKGTAMSFGKNLLSRLEVKMAAESTTRESLVREIMNAQETIISDSGEVRIHSSFTIYAPELVVFLGYNQQQLMMDLTDWFDCGHGPDGKWTYRTKNMGTDEITGIWVNLLGATTPDLLRSSLSLDAVGGGLTSRIIFIFEPDKYKSCPAPFLSPEELQLGETLYRDLERIHMLSGVFRYSQDFVELWCEWYMKQDKNPPFTDPHLAPYCERRATHIMKLSIILSASRSDEMIVRRKDLERAISILTNAERNMPMTFRGVGKSPHADVLSKVMQEIGLRGEMSMQELQRMFYHDADNRVLEVIVETIRSMGFIKRIEREDGTYLQYVKQEVKS